MSKKTNTLWFILAATVFNVLTTVVIMVVLLVIFVRVLAPVLPDSAVGWGLPVLFLVAIGLAFLAYQQIIKRVLKRIDVDKYFDPIFGGRRKPPIRRD
ncbi:MAG: leader peptide processing enzyme [Treponema sp.]|jgi:hypothetical protein|nr:leader peptide processing enzyme [Treponema sp.]